MRNKLSRLLDPSSKFCFHPLSFLGWLSPPSYEWQGKSITLDSVDFLYCLAHLVAPAHDLKAYAAVPHYHHILLPSSARAVRYYNPLTPKLSYFQSKCLQHSTYRHSPAHSKELMSLINNPLKKNQTPARNPTYTEMLVDCFYTPTKPASINKTHSDISKELRTSPLQQQPTAVGVVCNHIPNILKTLPTLVFLILMKRRQKICLPYLSWRS